MNKHTKHNPDLPEDLRSLEESLDTLGERMRSAAPDALGKRIADEGTAKITSPSRGNLRLLGTDADTVHTPAWRQHWRLAASITLLVVAVVAAISQNQSAVNPELIAGINADSNLIDDDWIDFEMQYTADTGWDDDAFELLASELDDLELSFNTAWTLDENLNLNEGESL